MSYDDRRCDNDHCRRFINLRTAVFYDHGYFCNQLCEFTWRDEYLPHTLTERERWLAS